MWIIANADGFVLMHDVFLPELSNADYFPSAFAANHKIAVLFGMKTAQALGIHAYCVARKES
jgi:hypothetical protein